MRKYLPILASLFWLTSLNAQDVNPKIRGGWNNTPFEDFAEELKKETGIHSYFKKEWVEDLYITTGPDSLMLRTLLGRHIYQHGLTYSLVNSDKLYLLPSKKLYTELPEFVVSEEEDWRKDGKDGLSESEEKYLQGRKADMTETILVGNRRADFPSRPVTITGSIINTESGEPVTGAAMIIQETGKGSITNAQGKVSMAITPGKYIVLFSFVGMKDEKAVLEVYDAGTFNLEMEPEVIALTEVQIVGNEFRKVKGTEMGVEKINVNAIKQIPVLMGEKDIIKVSQLLPGIVSASEASSGLNVRGGNADQNVFFIEDIPLFNTSHSFGFFSAFNSDIIRDFSIYKGNIPARYDGRLSSVFDVTTRKGNLKKYTAHAGISPISAHLTMEGPFQKEKGSILLSGRASYSDWLLNRVEDPLIRNSNASFYDIAASGFYKLGEKDNLNIFVYNSRDQIGLHELNNYDYENRGASFKWAHQFSPSFRSELSAIHSSYAFSTESINIPAMAYQHDYNIAHNEIKLNFNLLKGLNHEINFGGNVIYYPLDRGEVLPLGEDSYRNPVMLGKEQGLLTGIYLSDNITITKWLTLYAGLRFNRYTYLGPQEVNTYAEGSEKREENVNGSLTFNKWDPVVSYNGPAYRTGMNIKLASNASLKFSFSRMNQFLYMASNTVTLAPDDQWKLADYHLKPQSSYQYSAGLYKYFPDYDVNASIEFYKKENSNILEYKDGADFVNIPAAEMSVLQGQQSTEGVEFMLEKKSGRFDGWLSYTYSRSMVTVDGENPWERINNGEPYPSNYDKPHVLNLVGTFRINRIFVLSSSMVYSTGRPYTPPESLYYIDGQPYISFSSRNGDRIPDYFRSDVSLTIEGNLKKDKLFHSTWIFSVYNLTGRNNPQSIFFRSEDDEIKAYQLSIIGVPIFTVTWSVKLGNYASN